MQLNLFLVDVVWFREKSQRAKRLVAVALKCELFEAGGRNAHLNRDGTEGAAVSESRDHK